jgi:hypothetical protein
MRHAETLAQSECSAPSASQAIAECSSLLQRLRPLPKSPPSDHVLHVCDFRSGGLGGVAPGAARARQRGACELGRCCSAPHRLASPTSTRPPRHTILRTRCSNRSRACSSCSFLSLCPHVAKAHALSPPPHEPSSHSTPSRAGEGQGQGGGVGGGWGGAGGGIDGFSRWV